MSLIFVEKLQEYAKYVNLLVTTYPLTMTTKVENFAGSSVLFVIEV